MELVADDVRNRTNNLTAVAAMSIFGVIAVLEATIGEPDLNDKVDDGLFALLALAGLVWYLRGRHRYVRSLVPLALLGLGIVNKLYTIFGTEAGDPGARGDDIGFVLILGTATTVVLVSYWRSRGSVSVAEEVNRGNNLMTTALIAGLAVEMTHEALTEKWPDRIDDTVFVGLAAALVIWYAVRRNRYRRSILPLTIAAGCLAANVVAGAIEPGTGEDVVYAIIAAMVTVTSGVIYYRTGRVVRVGQVPDKGVPESTATT
jgi:hypothetical protein